MWALGPIGFTAPWMLWGLAALPLLWLLLRAVPPAPVRRRFPGVALLLGLRDATVTPDRTPWWLLLLRMLAVAALIVAFAGPVLNPAERRAGTGPLLIALDGTWADARDWPRRMERVAALVDEAGRAGRPVAVVTLTDPPAGGVAFQAAATVAPRLGGIAPRPWEPRAAAAWAAGLTGAFETYWLSDGLDRPGRAETLAAFEARGPVTVFEGERPLLALAPANFAGGAVGLAAQRLPAPEAARIEVVARGPDPAGVERDLARAELAFAGGAGAAAASLDLPPELRNRITRLAIAGERSAAAVQIADDGLRRRKVALLGQAEGREALQLLSPVHFLRQALAPSADLIEASLADALLAAPDVVVLADIARLSPEEAAALSDWVRRGGLLLRFAGPRLAASDVSRAAQDPLMPVRLRAGGRTVGGAMTWGEPKRLAPFPADSPFAGLAVPAEVTVTAQVLAQPDPELAARTIAALADGTPLVTRKPVGEGQVVLFHVTANAEWSSLPLSVLFVQMLERLAVAARVGQPGAAELAGATWVPVSVIDAFGEVAEAGRMAGVPGETLAAALRDGRPGPEVPPGLYEAGDRRVALNVIAAGTTLAPAVWPARIPVEGLGTMAERGLKGAFLIAALLLLLADVIAALRVSGRLAPARAAAAAVVLALLAVPAGPARADDAFAMRATADVVLAHVLTGDAEVDRLAAAGLRGLSRILYERTSVEPAEPIGVDIETDELAFFPFLYWPVTTAQPLPSAAAYRRLNEYLRTGGMILFDTRDADLAAAGGAAGGTPEGRRLQMLAAPLDIPPLEPVPGDHVLTRTFYLLQDFPGRHARGSVWVEAAPPDAERAEGMPFRNLNDGVTPVMIGGNDWAAAWALDTRGMPLFPVGRGFAGERQREIAFRFGVNLVMYVLTGNYKSDQVHVPALLERLGQ
jgi:hypothetical protein